MFAATNAIDDGWDLDEPSSVDDGWALDEEPIEQVLTIVADYEDEWEADIEIIEAEPEVDGWAISDEEAAFFAQGEALATARVPAEDFSDLGSVEPEDGFLKRLFKRTT